MNNYKELIEGLQENIGEDRCARMSDLISREALITVMETKCDESKPLDVLIRNVSVAAIKKAPAVDAVEVVHGRWKKSNDYGAHAFTRFYGICSACSFQVGYNSAVHYHYCPNCGAKMDEVSE